MNELKGIDLTFNYKDDRGEYTINANIGVESWNQWGADTKRLGHNVDLLEAIDAAVREHTRVVDEA